jgi:hypothetical protein
MAKLDTIFFLREGGRRGREPYHGGSDGASLGANANGRGSDLDVGAGKVDSGRQQNGGADAEVAVRACSVLGVG